MSMSSTQPPSENEYQDVRCVGVKILPPSIVECHENLGAYTTSNLLGHTWLLTGLLLHPVVIR